MVSLVLMLSALAAASDSTGRPAGMQVSFSAVLQAEEPEKAAEALIGRAQAAGGYFSRRSLEMVELRVPTPRSDAFIDSLPNLGLVLDRNLQTFSVDDQLTELASRLKAKKATLQDYYAMLKESSDSTVFTVQSAITQLQAEIESTVGELIKLQDALRFATITVSFRFQDRGAPLPTGASRFRWLNTLDLQKLLERFHYAWK